MNMATFQKSEQLIYETKTNRFDIIHGTWNLFTSKACSLLSLLHPLELWVETLSISHVQIEKP